MTRPKKARRQPISRLETFRLERGWTQAQLARKAGTTQQHVQRLEKHPEKMVPKMRQQLAEALDVNDQALIEPHRVPLVGTVGAGAHIFPVAHDPNEADALTVPCPPDMPWTRTAAVRVDGESMYPLAPGSLLYFVRDRVRPVEELYGRMCIVKIADDGPSLVKVLEPGSQAGLFTLMSTNGAPQKNLRLDEIYLVEEIRQLSR